MGYTIGQVAKKINLPTSTIRYYDTMGLLPFIHRKSSGIREFNDSDLSMLQIIECLKKTGMTIKDIKTFSDWCTMGDHSLQQRYNMFLERRITVENQIKELEESLTLIDHKCKYYQTALQAGTESIHKETKKPM